jgi:uncharacterized delta-60 repeat protein
MPPSLLAGRAISHFLTEPLEPRRLFAAGDLVESFGDGGLVLDPARDATSVVLQQDGKIVVAGATSGGDFWLARFASNGTPDDTFGDSGEVIVPHADRAADLVLLADQTIVALAGNDTLLAFDSQGDPETAFSGNGELDLAMFASTLAVDSSNRILVGGTEIGGSPHLGLARFTAAGEPDDDFDDDGFVTVEHDDFDFGSFHKIAFDADGNILALGTGYTGAIVPVIVRFDDQGAIDTDFEDDGWFLNGDEQFLHDLVLHPDSDRMVVAGSYLFDFSGNTDWKAGYLDDLLADDADFPFAELPLAATLTDARSVIVQADGKILVGGFLARDSSVDDTCDFLLVRYNADGTIDQTFGSDGIVTRNFQVSLSNNPNDRIREMVLLSDGSLLVVGSSDDTLVMANFQTTGAPGPEFAQLDDGVLRVHGTDSADAIDVSIDDDEVVVLRNFQEVRFDLADVDRVAVFGKEGADEILVHGDLRSYIAGGKGSDRLQGGNLNDRILGKSGDDSLYGEDGNDLLYGSAGDDTIFSSNGADELYGGPDDDTLNPGTNEGANLVYGRSGNDTILAQNSFADELFGGSGQDSAEADDEDETRSIESMLT